MKKKSIAIIIITLLVIVFAVVSTWYAYNMVITAVSNECSSNFASTAEMLAIQAEEVTDDDFSMLGSNYLYYGNAEIFVIERGTYDVIYNSKNVIIGAEYQDAFEGKGSVNGMKLVRCNLINEENKDKELLLFAPDRVVNASVYTVRQSFVIFLALEIFIFAAFIYLVFSNVYRRAEKSILEERLKKAEDADAAKTLFISNMSHDIRTPMASSIGFVDLAIENVDNKEKVVDYLKKVQSSNDHLLTLLNDIVDVNRIENGTITIREETHNLFAIAAGVTEMVKPQFEAKGIRFATDFSGIIDENIFCDKLHLNQVCLNIFSNAEKFTEPGGSVFFTISQKDSDEFGNAVYEFRIRDTGIGIGREFISHIYEPFERENITAVNKTKGAGLGLTITKNIVDLMGGAIACKSEVAVGTEFVILFRFKLANGMSARDDFEDLSGESHVERLRGKKVLLVEDNELNREMAKDLLEENGIIVNDVEDGTIAVAVMEEAQVGEYAAILMDIQMPTMDGYEATRRIRSIIKPQIANVPIIAMTANAFDEDKQMSLDAGMNAHVTKPIDIDNLLATLDKYI